MIFVNIISLFFLVIGILTYKYIYPKKKLNFFVLLLLISTLPLISILRPGAYESGDFNIHIFRIMSFYDSLKQGNLMPSWAGELNATYGNPLFIFNYSLPYYLISFFHFLGISFISSMKIYLALSLYLSGIFMYLWVKKLTNNKFASFASAIFYIFNPYHLIDVHFRATLGETTIFSLVPLLLYSIMLFLQKRKIIYFLLTALISQLLFLSHPMIAGIFIVICGLFVILVNIKKGIKRILLIVIALFAGAVGASYSWSSFLIYSSYMFPNPTASVFQDTFSGLLYSPWRYGFLFQGPNGELAYIIGYTQIFIIAFAIYILFKKRVSKKYIFSYIFWLVIFFTVLFFMSPYSRLIWAKAPFLSMLQSNRLLLPVALCTSVLAGYLTIFYSNTKKGKVFVGILLLITVSYTILNWGHRRVIAEIDDSILRKSVWKSTLNEGTTAYFLNNRWADLKNFWFSKLPENHIEILNGDAIIEPIQRTSVLHSYVINAKSPLVIKENTLYYPGWTLKSNDVDIKIHPGERGVINFSLPDGIQYVELVYKDILPYKIVKVISFVIFGFLSIALIYLSILKYKKIISHVLCIFWPNHNISPGI